MTDADRGLLAIIDRDGFTITTDRKLLGAILKTPDYMVAGMFLPIDPEQAEQALIHGTGVFLMRNKPLSLAKELALRDQMQALSLKLEKSINDVWTAHVEKMLQEIPPRKQG
jgi:hypothetical protein